jgi:hypothetical protein
MGLGLSQDDEPEAESAAYPHATPPPLEQAPGPVEASELTDHAPAPRRGRHLRQAEFDDDFSNTSWLD